MIPDRSSIPKPANEKERLKALAEYKILDTASEQVYDDAVKLACFIAQTPIATITFIDHDRQWFKASVGLSERETPRDRAFCAHTILGEDTLLVNDAQKDTRFADNPLVTGRPGIRFYAGNPLRNNEGYALGSLCVIDQKPRELKPEQVEALQSLARQVMVILEMRRVSDQLAESLQQVNQLRDLLPICSYCRKVRDDSGYWEQVEGYILRHTGSRFSHGICPICMKEHFPGIKVEGV